MKKHRYLPPVISEVRAGSPADHAGIHTGDALLTVNGRRLPDVIAYMEEADAEALALQLERDGRRFRVDIHKQPGDPLGISFASAVFDRTRFCSNHCDFCFVEQLPPGLRPGLYEKDDDYRLSFLQGNFISLTNLGASDRRRILSSRLSPLYVSLQSAEPELRARIFGNRRAASSLKFLEELLDAGLEIHLQVVVCPGINDGPALRRTLELVERRFRAAASLGLVPAGFTRCGPSDMRRVGACEAREVLGIVREFQELWRGRLGRRLVYASDEFYLAGGEDFPPGDDYEGYPQLANGIGLARKLIDEVENAAASCPPDCTSRLAVTGQAGAEILSRALRVAGLEEEAARACLLPVPNRLFGPEITVTGLVVGEDIVFAYRESETTARRLLVPTCMLRDGVFLDDMRVEDLARTLGVEVAVVDPDGVSLLEALAGREVAA